MLKALEEKYKDNSNIILDYERQNIYSLKKADIMISDFSGIIFDYIFLCDKPVLYVNEGMDLRPYDAYDLGDKKLWQYKNLEQFGRKLEEQDFSGIKEIILNMKDSQKLKEARAKAKNEAWMFPGEAGKNITDFMLKTIM